MGDAPTVSVVIPTHDRWDLLPTTLGTVLGQRDVDLEVLVVDDGSPTAPPPLPDDPRLVVLRNPEPLGVAGARNRGLAAARGRYVAFVDDDDLWAPDKLALQVAALEVGPSAWACCSAVLVDDELRVVSPQPVVAVGEVADRLLQTNPVPGGGSGVLAETALVRSAGGYDPAFSMIADWDLWVRLALRSPLTAVDRPLLAYRLHAGAMSWRHGGTRPEVTRFEAKHAGELAARGLSVGWPQLELWMAGRRQRNGERLGPALGYLRSGPVIGRRRAAVRALEAFLWPGAFRLRDRRWGRRLRADWQVELDAWLPALAGEERRRLGAPEGGPGGGASAQLVGSDVAGAASRSGASEVVAGPR